MRSDEKWCVFVHKVEPNKIYLLLQGVLGELCKEGQIRVGNEKFNSLTGFSMQVFSYRNSKVIDNLPYYYLGTCGSISEFTTTLHGSLRLRHIYKAITGKYNTPATEKQEKLDTSGDATDRPNPEKQENSGFISLSQISKIYEAIKSMRYTFVAWDDTSDEDDEYVPLLNTTDTESLLGKLKTRPLQTHIHSPSSLNLRKRPIHKLNSLNNGLLLPEASLNHNNASGEQ